MISAPLEGMMGLVSKSCKQRIKEGLLVRPKMFQDDMGDDRDFVISSDEDDGKNPWGTLAKSWSNIDRARQPPPLPPIDDGNDFFYDIVNCFLSGGFVINECFVKLFIPVLYGPPLPPALPPILRLPPTMPIPPHSILNRVGVRSTGERRMAHGRSSRHKSKSRSKSKSLSPVLQKSRLPIHARLHGKHRRRDENDSEDSAFSGSESENEAWTRKNKLPRMRMYADEEEIKVKERTKV